MAVTSTKVRYARTDFEWLLHAKWAVFFDCAGWFWEYKPKRVINGWQPTFFVSIPCTHSECGGHHTLLCEVMSFDTIQDFKGRSCWRYPYGLDENRQCIGADSSAALGSSPRVSWWEIGHGSGGGEECVENWTRLDIDSVWEKCVELIELLKE